MFNISAFVYIKINLKSLCFLYCLINIFGIRGIIILTTGKQQQNKDTPRHFRFVNNLTEFLVENR